MANVIRLEKTVHRNQQRLKLIFDRDEALVRQVRSVRDCRWSASMHCWHIPYYDNHLAFLNRKLNGEIQFLPLPDVAERGVCLSPNAGPGRDAGYPQPAKDRTAPPGAVAPNLSARMPRAFVEQLKMRRYSDNTIKAYTSTFARFLEFNADREPEAIEPERIRTYILHLVEKTEVSSSYQNQAINAIKFYFEAVLGRTLEPMVIQRPRKEKKLPQVLSEEEVALIFKQITNLKHKCAIYIIYSAGLRRSEVLNLKPTDIDSKRNCIVIRDAKGKKDRITLFSQKTLKLLRAYYQQYRRKQWLFEGAEGGRYSATSLRNIFQRALDKSGIQKDVSLHSLRHYVPFLTMSGNVKNFADMLGICRLRHAETDPSTRHSFSVDSCPIHSAITDRSTPACGHGVPQAVYSDTLLF